MNKRESRRSGDVDDRPEVKLPELKPSSQQKYAEALDLHILPALGDYYLDAIRPPDVSRFPDQAAETYKPATVNSWLQLLRTLLRDAVSDLGLLHDPVARVRTLPVPEQERRSLSGDELCALLDAAKRMDPEIYPILLTLALTGMRIGEARALKWDDIDDHEGVIHICRGSWKQHVGTTKTGKTRSVPLPVELADELRLHRQRLLERQASGLADGWVFPSAHGTMIYASSLHGPLARACKAADITRRFTLHGLRHTFNNLVRQVATGDVARALTGHSTEQR